MHAAADGSQHTSRRLPAAKMKYHAMVPAVAAAAAVHQQTAAGGSGAEGAGMHATASALETEAGAAAAVEGKRRAGWKLRRSARSTIVPASGPRRS